MKAFKEQIKLHTLSNKVGLSLLDACFFSIIGKERILILMRFATDVLVNEKCGRDEQVEMR